MKLSAITRENVDGFKALLLPEVFAAIRKGENLGAIGLLEDEKKVHSAVGAIAGIVREDTFQILSLMVEEKYRGKGFGKQLLNAMEAEAKEFHLPVLFDFPDVTEGQHLLSGFLLHQGYGEGEIDFPLVRFPLSEVEEGGGKKQEEHVTCLPFSKLSEQILSAADEKAKRELLPMPEGGLLSNQINRDCSLGVETKGELTAYVTFEELSPKEILLSSFWCQYPMVETEVVLLEAFREARRVYPEETEVFAFIGSDVLGDFIGGHVKNPETVSRRFVK